MSEGEKLTLTWDRRAGCWRITQVGKVVHMAQGVDIECGGVRVGRCVRVRQSAGVIELTGQVVNGVIQLESEKRSMTPADAEYDAAVPVEMSEDEIRQLVDRVVGKHVCSKCGGSAVERSCKYHWHCRGCSPIEGTCQVCEGLTLGSLEVVYDQKGVKHTRGEQDG